MFCHDNRDVRPQAGIKLQRADISVGKHLEKHRGRQCLQGSSSPSQWLFSATLPSGMAMGCGKEAGVPVAMPQWNKAAVLAGRVGHREPRSMREGGWKLGNKGCGKDWLLHSHPPALHPAGRDEFC